MEVFGGSGPEVHREHWVLCRRVRSGCVMMWIIHVFECCWSLETRFVDVDNVYFVNVGICDGEVSYFVDCSAKVSQDRMSLL